MEMKRKYSKKKESSVFKDNEKKCIDWVDVAYEDHVGSYEVRVCSRPPW